MPYPHVWSIMLALLLAVACSGQDLPVLVLSQPRDNAPATHLTAAQLAELGDPFFSLFLKEHAGETSLLQIEKLIQPNDSKRRLFVVDEAIANGSRGQSRRAVIAFTGTNAGEVLDTNLMLSVLFNSEDFPDGQPIEAWGWDNHRGRYNYYKLDRSGTPDQRMSWKFRGSSVGADQLNQFDRQGTCMACHLNGAPLMKELLFPWNNWHSNQSLARYLLPTTDGGSRWPVVQNERLKQLAGAEDLEGMLLAATRQFNTRRINTGLARRDADGNIEETNGKHTIKEGRRLIRPLFVTTEFNLISSRVKSGLHPLGPSPSGEPQQPVAIPNSFFLNANLIVGGGITGYRGLGISEASGFRSFALIQPAEYKTLVKDSRIRVAGEVGDTDFAWLTPEPSHIDNDMIDRLMSRGIITPQFVAAVLSVDLETPVLSSSRESLLRVIPEQWSFVPLKEGDDPFAEGRFPDELTRQVIADLETQQPENGTPTANFLAALKHDDPLGRLREQVETYAAKVKSRLEGETTRPDELKRIQQRLIDGRKAVLQDPSFRRLDETGGRLLLPLP